MVQENISLSAFNTFGFQVNSKYFTSFSNENELLEILQNPITQQNQILPLGGGSNILFTQDFDGIVLKNDMQGIEIVSENESQIEVAVGGGVVWHQFVLHAVDQNWGGIENLSLIPGTVGAAPIQNIGAYGVEVKDVITKVEAIHIKDFTKETFTNESCQFGYRNSVFKQALKGQYIITKVYFQLTKNQHVLHLSYGAIQQTLAQMGVENPTIKDISQAVISIRESKLPDPAKIGNAGSFFKNPEISIDLLSKIKENYPTVVSYPINAQTVKLAAGWLIENAGWKGKTLGEVGVHKDQALVLVHYGNGKGSQIKALSQAIQKDVFEKFGVSLEAEVNMI